ncbi:MAG: circadian clock protein KaiC [Spirochaetaceae bacterium]|jgi:circadian clock protein KaiC|nr:circadian clock protein KaiC [Spirochaetaceae bacterium]
MKNNIREESQQLLPKSPTGIQGLDEITYGGFPKGRPTLICGNAGCGKTLLAMEFLVHGARIYEEPGVFISFEESVEDLSVNVASLGFDLDKLIEQKKMLIDYVLIKRSELETSGNFDLEGLFIRLANAIDSIAAKRVVLDTIESLFSCIPDPIILRSELHRLFRWLKDKGVTAIITGERGNGSLTRNGLEEYVSDCVLLLDQRIIDQNSTRRLRVVKYRGSVHGTNEYPFLIDESGISVTPITSLGLNSIAPTDRISSGIPALDSMLEGKGYFRGSTILVSGSAGSGKTSITAHFVAAACKRGERVLFFCYEESPSQIKRNMLAIGIDLGAWEKTGLLQVHATRPTVYGLEMHLSVSQNIIDQFKPHIVIFDPINTFSIGDNSVNVNKLLICLVDFLKLRQISTLFTALDSRENPLKHLFVSTSYMIDTWLLLRVIEVRDEQNRTMYVLKSRGIANSNQIREFIITDKGVDLCDVYTGSLEVLTGSTRLAREAEEKADELLIIEDTERKKLVLERKRKALEAKIESIRIEFEAEELLATNELIIEQNKLMRLQQDRFEMEKSRKVINSGISERESGKNKKRRQE